MSDHRSVAASLLAFALTTTAPLSGHAQTGPAQAQAQAAQGDDGGAAKSSEYPPVTELVTSEQLRATLQLLLSRGMITRRDYDNALLGKGPGLSAPPPAPTTPPSPPPKPPVTSKWDAELYGFVEADTLVDSTQSFSELAGGTVIARPGTYPGDHGRITFTIRNSRLGFRIKAPEYHGVKVSGMAEMDFLGNQPPNSSELATFTFPTFRVRHFMVKVETPYITLLAGQYWQLFGWQTYGHPDTVAIQGVPGQIYSRTPQIRLSHIFKTAPLDIELAGAVARAPQRDSMVPDGQAGIRLAINPLRGVQTVGTGPTNVVPAFIGVSGTMRYFAVPEFSAMPKESSTTYGWGVAVDTAIPIIPAKERKAGALTFTGSFAHGTGIADYYVMQNGGVSNPPLVGSTAAYNPDIDNGLVIYDKGGQLTTVDWQSFMVGLQFYLPPQGRLWVSSNYSQMNSDNSQSLGNANQVYTQSRWADANLFWEATPAVRFGIEYQWFQQEYADGIVATNHRGWFSSLLLF